MTRRAEVDIKRDILHWASNRPIISEAIKFLEMGNLKRVRTLIEEARTREYPDFANTQDHYLFWYSSITHKSKVIQYLRHAGQIRSVVRGTILRYDNEDFFLNRSAHIKRSDIDGIYVPYGVFILHDEEVWSLREHIEKVPHRFTEGRPFYIERHDGTWEKIELDEEGNFV